MDQSMNFESMPMNNGGFAFNNISNAPSTTEHRSVLVSRKFINGLVTNYNKNKNNVENDYTAPNFEVPKFEMPKFDFKSEVEVEPVTKNDVTSPIQPSSQEEPKFEIPKFDFSSIGNSVEQKPVQPVVNVAPGQEEPSSDEGTAININNYNNFDNITNEELLAKYANIDGISTETMLFEVQNTLNSLANMVSVLTQQRTDLLAQQEEISEANEALDKREEEVVAKEKSVEEAEKANETQRQEIEKLAADNARQLSERTLALKAKAQELEDKERAYMNRVEELNKDIAKNVEDAKMLKKRAEELNAKEAELDKLSVELKGRLNNLVDAENKFKVIVKEFNDTVSFNNTLNSITPSTKAPLITPSAKQLKKELNEEKAA